MTSAQKRVLDLLGKGERLWWFGDSGPEMSGHPFWPQKRTVRAMLRDGLLRWKEYQNESQRQAGFCELKMVEEDHP